MPDYKPPLPTSRLFKTVGEAPYQKAYKRLELLRAQAGGYRDDELLMFALANNAVFDVWALAALTRLFSLARSAQSKLFSFQFGIPPELDELIKLVYRQAVTLGIIDPGEDGNLIDISLQDGQLITVNMLIFCPKCGGQHIDAPEPETGWGNPPHKSHTCHHCDTDGKPTIFRVADFATNGVAKIATSGANDSWHL